MKKILLGLFFLPILLFSYEINFSKTFSKSVSPDLLTTYITVSVSSAEELEVNRKIERFNDFIKGYSEVQAKDGRYTLSPKYKYVNNKQIFTGYVGNLRYKIESKDATKINEFINEILEQKQRIKGDNVELNISNVNWDISNKLYEQSVDNLRVKTILWINEYAKELSSKISKNCEVKTININSNSRRNVYAVREMAMSSKVAADVTPASSDEDITLNPSFVLECR